MTPEERQARVDAAQAEVDARQAIVDSIDKTAQPKAYRSAVDKRNQWQLGLNIARKVQERELRAAALDGHTEEALDRVPSGGGELAHWGQDAENPEIVRYGEIIDAFTLSDITRQFGVTIAFMVDLGCRPCEICGRKTYGTVCEECADHAPHAAITEQSLERAGTFEPRLYF